MFTSAHTLAHSLTHFRIRFIKNTRTYKNVDYRWRVLWLQIYVFLYPFFTGSKCVCVSLCVYCCTLVLNQSKAKSQLFSASDACAGYRVNLVEFSCCCCCWRWSASGTHAHNFYRIFHICREIKAKTKFVNIFHPFLPLAIFKLNLLLHETNIKKECVSFAMANRTN